MDVSNLFSLLLEEKQKFDMSGLISKEYDMTKMRKIAEEMNEKLDCGFMTEGTDAQLMESINKYVEQFRP